MLQDDGASLRSGDTIAAGLPDGWTQGQSATRRYARERRRPGRGAARAASPRPIRERATAPRHGRAAPAGPALLRRLLAGLDGEGITRHARPCRRGGARTREAPPDENLPTTLAGRLGRSRRERCPRTGATCSALSSLRSSDDASAGRTRGRRRSTRPDTGRRPAFRFRVARRFGYGAAPEMARRCLARLDEEGIPGTAHTARGLSDTKPVATQGPTFLIVGQGGLVLAITSRVRGIKERARSLARLQARARDARAQAEGKGAGHRRSARRSSRSSSCFTPSGSPSPRPRSASQKRFRSGQRCSIVSGLLVLTAGVLALRGRPRCP